MIVNISYRYLRILPKAIYLYRNNVLFAFHDIGVRYFYSQTKINIFFTELPQTIRNSITGNSCHNEVTWNRKRFLQFFFCFSYLKQLKVDNWKSCWKHLNEHQIYYLICFFKFESVTYIKQIDRQNIFRIEISLKMYLSYFSSTPTIIYFHI